jgi:hypothetical protein
MKKLLISLTVLLICTVASQNARAQSDIGFKSVGVNLGLVNPENLDATPGFGAFADLGTLNPNIHWSAHLDYWSHSEGVPGGGDVSVGDVSLSSRGTYVFEVKSSRIQPYAGAGLGIHFISSKVEIPDRCRWHRSRAARPTHSTARCRHRRRAQGADQPEDRLRERRLVQHRRPGEHAVAQGGRGVQAVV